MLYFSCCSRNKGVIKEGSILRWMMCALDLLNEPPRPILRSCMSYEEEVKFSQMHFPVLMVWI